MAYSPSNAAWSGVNKTTKKAAKVAQEALSWMLPVGKPVKAVKAVKSISAAKKAKKVSRTLAEPKSNVKIKPARTATGPGLETRGAKLTKSQRSERAAELSFKKLEGRWEGEYLTRMTGLRGPKGITSQTTRGQGKRSLRKDAAIDKEAKPVVKINSAVKTRTADQARASANATARVTPSRVPAKPAERRVMINSGKSGKPVVKRLAVKSTKKK